MADPGNGTPTDELNLLLIVCELAGPMNGDGSSNPDLRAALEGYPVMAQLTDTTWLLRTPRSVAGVFDALDRHLDPEDRLFVGAITGEAAWRNIEAGYGWLVETFEPGGPIEGRAA